MNAKIENSNGKIAEYNVAECSEGSEKQINWANQIKAEKICDLLNWMCELKEESQKDQVMIAIKKIDENINAKFWIDNRSTTARNIYKEMR